MSNECQCLSEVPETPRAIHFDFADFTRHVLLQHQHRINYANYASTAPPQLGFLR